MRVIAGSAKGVPLKTIKEWTTRPTLDRVKENLFNIIQGYIPDANVLDCFSGSGSLCIECLSRGAKHATFIERNFKAIECIKLNLEKTRFTDQASIYQGTYDTILPRLKSLCLTFDIIFLDPPHRSGFSEKAMKIIKDLHLLNTHGIIVAEHHILETYENSIEGFSKYRSVTYGNTTLSFYEEE